jgi:hypothetical protein
MRADSPLLPVSPKDFKEVVDTGMYMVDQIGSQTRIDPASGSEVSPEEDPSLFTVVTGCVWNSQYATLIKAGKEGESPDMMILNQFALVVSLIPEGKDMRYDTHSDWLIQQLDDMCAWTARGYQGLDRDVCMPQWSGIMRLVEEGQRQVALMKIDETSTTGAVL